MFEVMERSVVRGDFGVEFIWSIWARTHYSVDRSHAGDVTNVRYRLQPHTNFTCIGEMSVSIREQW